MFLSTAFRLPSCVSKGNRPRSMAYRITPALQMSALTGSYPSGLCFGSRTSGDMYAGVPTRLVIIMSAVSVSEGGECVSD